MVTKPSSSSLTRFLIKNGLAWFIALVLMFALVSGGVAIKLMAELSLEKTQLSQQLFASSMSDDLLIGLESAVFKKCESMFRDPGVLAVIVEVGNQAYCNLKKEQWPDGQLVSTDVFFDAKRESRAATVKVYYDGSTIRRLIHRLAFFWLVALLGSGIVLFVLVRRLKVAVLAPIELLSLRLKPGLSQFTNAERARLAESEITEIRNLLSSFLDSYERVEEYQAQALRDVSAQTLVSVAQQVAHDIRSPLAAIGSLDKDLAALPEDKRLMMRGAVNRIKDIANNLLQKNRELMTPPGKSVEGPIEIVSTVLLSSVLEPLITEKRMQFRSRLGIEIEGRIDAASYGLFARIQPAEFKRALSNLINNAVEELGEKGAVSVSLGGGGTGIAVVVRDSGKGIPPEILAKLGQQGETHGKPGGSGLGLYHARTSVESWGGNLRIDSEPGKGTMVTVALPSAPPPDWFVSELKLTPDTTIIVLDDDTSIHQIWQGRFDSLRVFEKRILIVHLSTPDQLRNWILENSVAAQTALYLADYELLGFKETGLSLIEELELGPQSILVTSRFEEQLILEGCQRLKVRLIPKGMAGFVPVFFGEALELLDAILIDDDELVHLTWKNSAKHFGKKIRTFTEPGEFFAIADVFSRATSVYVDGNLGQGIRGEVVADRIYKMGFSRVYLATGDEPEKYQSLSFLTGVIGKEPPFGV